MKNNRLLIALVVLIGVGALAVSATRSHQAETTVEAPAEKLPTLKKEDLTEIEIIKPTKETITLAKKDGAWQVASPVPAKADTTAIDTLLDKLTTIEILGVAATRKENHARLQVDEGAGLEVKVKASGKLALDLFVGSSKTGNTMVRLAGKDTVLVAKGGLRFALDKEAKLFRDRVITDVDSNELTALSVESAKGSFKFTKTDKWTQAPGEKPLKDFSDMKVQTLASTLSRLRAADFAEPSVSPDAAGFSTPDSKVTLTPKTGAPIVLELGKLHPAGNEYYARVSGKDTIFRISKFTAERMLADATAFAADKKDESKDNAGAAPMGMPEGMPEGAPSQLPPEILEQLKRQLATQGGAHP